MEESPVFVGRSEEPARLLEYSPAEYNKEEGKAAEDSSNGSAP